MNPQTIEGATQEDEIEFQTQELEFSLYRDDSADTVWLKQGGEYTTEAEAETKITTFFG